MWVVSMEFAACHLSGASIYELVPRYRENLLADLKLRHFETIFVTNQMLFVSLVCTVVTYSYFEKIFSLVHHCRH